MSYGPLTSAYGTPTKQAAVSISTIQAGLGGFTLEFGMIYAAAASFLTNGVRPGDGAVITGTTFNNGTYRIAAVLGQDHIIVENGLVDESGGTIAVDTGTHTYTITDEATTDWATIAQKIKKPNICNVLPSRGDINSYDLIDHCLDRIKIVHTGATDTQWDSARELVVCHQDGLTGTWEIEFLSATAGTFGIKLGVLNDAADRRSYDDGSVWIGCEFPDDASGGNSDDFQLEAYASLLAIGAVGKRISTGKGGLLFGCIIDGDIVVPATTTASGVELQDLIIISDDEPIRIGDTIDHAENIIIARSSDDATCQSGPAVILNKVTLGDDAFVPAFRINNTDVDFRDLDEDYAPATLYTVLTNGIARKSYTWTPRVVERRAPADGGGLARALSGVRVDVKLIEVERAAFVAFGITSPADGDYTVTINGTDFTHAAVSQTRGAITDALIVLINAGAEPVTAAIHADGLERGVHITPDDAEVEFTFAVSTDADAWSVRDHVVSVSGSPFTTAADGTIGDVVLETHLHDIDGGDKQPFNRQLYVVVTEDGYSQAVVQRKVDRALREDITLVPWSPNRAAPAQENVL